MHRDNSETSWEYGYRLSISDSYKRQGPWAAWARDALKLKVFRSLLAVFSLIDDPWTFWGSSGPARFAWVWKITNISCIHAYMITYMPTCIHTCIHTYYACIHTMHAYFEYIHTMNTYYECIHTMHAYYAESHRPECVEPLGPKWLMHGPGEQSWRFRVRFCVIVASKRA